MKKIPKEKNQNKNTCFENYIWLTNKNSIEELN